MVITTSAILVTSTVSSSFLYLLRVHAILCHWKATRFLLLFLWAGICATACMIPFAISSHTIGPTKFCLPVLDAIWGSPLWPVVIWATFDTLAFLLVSYDLLTTMNTRFGHRTPWWRQPVSTLTGRYLPRLARSFFRRGTKYYLYVSLPF